jgi:hypothetical protein
MLLIRFLLLLASISPSISGAEVQCTTLARMADLADTVVVVVYDGGTRILDSDSRKRARRDFVSNTLRDFRDDIALLAKNANSKTVPRFVLVNCGDESIDEGSISTSGLTFFKNSNVISIFWGTQDQGKPAVAHLSLPHYFKLGTLEKQESQVRWVREKNTGNDIEDWTHELTRNHSVRKVLLMLGMGLLSLENKNWPLAMMSLCQARKTLKVALKEPLITTDFARFENRVNSVVLFAILIIGNQKTIQLVGLRKFN